MKETRPFDTDAARAGAPYACKSGAAAAILKWDAVHLNYPLIGYVTEDGYDYMEAWRTDGRCDDNDGQRYERRDLVMLPIGEIDGKPVFVGDEVVAMYGACQGETMRVLATWGKADWPAFKWPSPAKKYPVTRLNHGELFSAYERGMCRRPELWSEEGCREVANAALRHAVDGKQLFIKEDVDKAIDAVMALYNGAKADRSARDMAIAEAVSRQYSAIISSATNPSRPPMKNAAAWINDMAMEIDLAAIIKGVK